VVASPVVQQVDAETAESDLLARLRAGDERAFSALVNRDHSSMVRLARTFVASQAVAEEVAQETWLAVIRGLPGFEGRSTLRTWTMSILVRTARNRAARERRSLPFSALAYAHDDDIDGGPTVNPSRFRPVGEPYAGFWAAPPHRWWSDPEPRALAAETGHIVQAALDALPPVQAQVVQLRDVEGWSAAEVCDALELTQANQRVLLHRGRAKLRAALEEHFEQGVQS